MRFLGFAGESPVGLEALAAAPGTAGSSSRLITAPFGPGGKCGVLAEYTAAADGILVGVCGRPTATDSRPAGSAGQESPAAVMLRSYLTHGRQLPEHLQGSFAVAVIDARRRETLLAIDRIGVERLAFAPWPGGVVFSDSALAVSRLIAPAPRLRLQAIYDYLLLHMVPAPDTVFEGVRKLRPGTSAAIDATETKVAQYWTPTFHEGAAAAFDALKEELHRSLLDAVTRTEIDERTGAFLSGGLDSSSVAGMLTKATGRPSKTFSVGFGVESYDELSYARIANKRFGSFGREIHVTAADISDSFELIAAAYDEPFGNSSAVPTYCCAKTAASDGVSHLLAGDGGDEIFGGNERYVRQRIFELYQRIPMPLRKWLIEPVTGLVDPESRIGPIRKLRSYIDQARIPMPERLESWNFVYRHGADSILDPELRAAIDTQAPLRNMKEVYDSVPDAKVPDWARPAFYSKS